jgi:hypothetical protein
MNYDIEPTLEGALVTLLSNRGITAGGSLTTEELSTPRVDVRFELGAERPIHLSNGTGLGVSNTYDGQFILSVITDRDENASSHSSFRATVREAMAESSATDWEAAIGGSYRVLSVAHLSTTYEVLANDTALDASVMSYSATIRFN